VAAKATAVDEGVKAWWCRIALRSQPSKSCSIAHSVDERSSEGEGVEAVPWLRVSVSVRG